MKKNKGFTPTPEQSSFSKKGTKCNGCLVWGFTLIELIISVFIITIALSGAFGILQRIITSTYLSSSKLIASYLAQEGIEIVRNIRDTNWLKEAADWKTGINECSFSIGKFCEGDYDQEDTLTIWPEGTVPRLLKIDNQGFYNYDSGKNTKFKRKIYVDDIPGIEGVKVRVLVQWQDYGRSYEVPAQEYLYNWYDY